jgi:anaerobic magnesium-protoporphyrin IX monomethyl ester cyclase
MRVLLTTLNAKYIHTNLAIRLLYQLNKHREGLDWKEFTINEAQQPVAEHCAQYDMVAFSCYIWNITQTLQVARLIKALRPEVRILLGGPEVSYEWEDVIARPEVDYIIAGEGETAFQQLLDAYPHTDHVPGLIFKKSDSVQENKPAPMFDLQQMADIMPYADDDVELLRNKVLYLETSRGCPYKCEFCLASLDNKVRYLPDASIKATLLFLMQHGRVIKFLDRTFNIKKNFTIDVFDFILAHHRPGNVFQFEITADIVHPDIIQFIQEKVPPGLFRFEIGIQTVNQKANLEVSRKQNFDKTKSIIQALSDKIEMHLDLIVGLPLDYYSDIRYSFEEVFKLFAPELQLGFLKLLKGTPVRDKHVQHGFLFDHEPPYQLIKSNYLSRAEIQQILDLEHALEIYWNKKRACHALRYITNTYSIFDFLQGLGSYFLQQKNGLSYTLREVYDILLQYAQQHFPEDVSLQDLIALDYYTQYKVKPQLLTENGQTTIAKQQLLLSLSFDYNIWITSHEIQKSNSSIRIQYNGKSLPDVAAVSTAMI